MRYERYKVLVKTVPVTATATGIATRRFYRVWDSRLDVYKCAPCPSIRAIQKLCRELNEGEDKHDSTDVKAVD